MKFRIEAPEYIENDDELHKVNSDMALIDGSIRRQL